MQSAKEILRELGCSINLCNDIECYQVDTDEDHVVNAMIVFAQQVLELAAEQAKIVDKKVLYTGMRAGNPDTAYYIVKEIDKNSILNLKTQIQ